MAAYRTGWSSPLPGVLELYGASSRRLLIPSALLLVVAIIAACTGGSVITCTRTGPNVGSCWGAKRTMALADVQGLSLETEMSKPQIDVHGRERPPELFHRLQVVTTYGAYPVEGFWTNGPTAGDEALIASFDTFLHGTAPSFPSRATQLRPYLLAFAFAAAALALYLTAGRRRTVVRVALDASRTQLQVTRTGPDGMQTDLVPFRPRPWVTTVDDLGTWLCLAHGDKRTKLILVPNNATDQGALMNRVDAFLGPDEEGLLPPPV